MIKKQTILLPLTKKERRFFESKALTKTTIYNSALRPGSPSTRLPHTVLKHVEARMRDGIMERFSSEWVNKENHNQLGMFSFEVTYTDGSKGICPGFGTSQRDAFRLMGGDWSEVESVKPHKCPPDYCVRNQMESEGKL